jgi:hypothetical protein
MSKTGKHGHAKFTFQLKYPLTGQTSQEMFPGHTHLTRPIVKKFEWMVTAYENGSFTCLDEANNEVFLSITEDFNHTDHGVKGKDLLAAWTRFENGEMQDQEIWLSVSEAPVKGKSEKEHILVRQITEFKLKQAE